jgi:tetratricopeptide (TPR) repeat protein
MPVEAPETTELRCVRCGRIMPDGSYWCPACGKLNASPRVRLVFILFVIAILAGVGLTKWYVSYLRDLESSLAERWFTRGEQAIAKNYPSVAIDDYHNALGYDEGNRQYRLKLAEALMKEGRLSEARAYLTLLWSQDPANAQVNLNLARLYAQQNKPDLAARHYGTAIDGIWSDNPLQHRTEARFELVQYLIHLGNRARAVAELIAVQAESPEDPEIQLKAGNLLLQLGENARAAKSFDAVLKVNGDNVDALTGAGQAALALGDYRKAVGLLTVADNLTHSKPGSPQADLLALAHEVLEADPYLRNLTITQRANRVADAFSLSMQMLRNCAAQKNITLAPQSPTLAPKEETPALPTKQNGYTATAAPSALAPNSLQLLYDSGLQKQPSAKTEALRRNPDAISPTMDFVFEVLRATENVCPLETTQERALQFIARHEAKEQR